MWGCCDEVPEQLRESLEAGHLDAALRGLFRVLRNVLRRLLPGSLR